MADSRERLRLEVSRRNARLRAWCALGVPVGGGWECRGQISMVACCRLRCLACGKAQSLGTEIRTSRMDQLPAAERASILALEQLGCPHLSPLYLVEDPPELHAIWELELLAGG